MAIIPSSHSPLMSTLDAAIYLGVSPRWLEALRVRGGGPTYQKLGRRVLYRVEHLELWAESRSRQSTSQEG